MRLLADRDQPHNGVPAAAHELPPRLIGHGLLGRNFFARLLLTIDFSRSTASVCRTGRRWWPFGR